MTAPEIVIPEDAEKAAEEAVIEALSPGYPASPGYIARAACLAMLKAWPNMSVRTHGYDGYLSTRITLPLPKGPEI